MATKEEKLENIIAIVIVGALCVGLVVWIWSAMHPEVVQQETWYDIPYGVSPRLGNEHAPVVVFEFSDFECPYCGQFAREFEEIKQNHIDTGEVLFIYKYMPLAKIHSHAVKAAEAAACADAQNAFWEYHDKLYENQNALEIENLQTYAEELELDAEKFNECLSSGSKRGEVELDLQAGIDNGITGTPTFFFNGKRVPGYLTATQFAQKVEEAVNKVEIQ